MDEGRSPEQFLTSRADVIGALREHEGCTQQLARAIPELGQIEIAQQSLCVRHGWEITLAVHHPNAGEGLCPDISFVTVPLELARPIFEDSSSTSARDRVHKVLVAGWN